MLCSASNTQYSRNSSTVLTVTTEYSRNEKKIASSPEMLGGSFMRPNVADKNGQSYDNTSATSTSNTNVKHVT